MASPAIRAGRAGRAGRRRAALRIVVAGSGLVRAALGSRIVGYGRIRTYRSASGFGIRLDGGTAYAGALITPYYDSLLVKIMRSRIWSNNSVAIRLREHRVTRGAWRGEAVSPVGRWYYTWQICLKEAPIGSHQAVLPANQWLDRLEL